MTLLSFCKTFTKSCFGLSCWLEILMQHDVNPYRETYEPLHSTLDLKYFKNTTVSIHIVLQRFTREEDFTKLLINSLFSLRVALKEIKKVCGTDSITPRRWLHLKTQHTFDIFWDKAPMPLAGQLSYLANPEMSGPFSNGTTMAVIRNGVSIYHQWLGLSARPAEGTVRGDIQCWQRFCQSDLRSQNRLDASLSKPPFTPMWRCV